MLTGPLPDALTVIQVVNSLSDTYPAQVVELYEGIELVGLFHTRQHTFVRGYYKLATPTHTIFFAAQAALCVFLGDRAERPVTVVIAPTTKSPCDGEQMQEHLGQVMMAAALAKDTMWQRWDTPEIVKGHKNAESSSVATTR